MTTAHDNLPPLRVGVLLADLRAPAWVAHLLRRLREVDVVCLEAWATPPRTISDARSDFPSRPLRLYRRLDRLVAPATHDAFQPFDVSDLLADVTRLDDPARGRSGHNEAAAHTPPPRQGEALDVLIDLTDGDAVTLSAVRPKSGVWVFRGGPQADVPLDDLAMQEFNRRDDLLHTWIVRTELHRPVDPLDRAVHAVDPSSLARTRSRACWHLADQMLRCLRRARDGDLTGDSTIFDDSEPPREDGLISGGSTPGVPPPLGLGLTIRQTGRFARNRLWNRLHDYRWELAMRPVNPSQPCPVETDGFRSMEPPPGRLWADPFVIHHDDETHLFFEDMPLGGRRGVIARGKLTSDGRLTDVMTVLEGEGHLSYPCVFAWNDEVYMVPESAAGRSVVLYRAAEFPHRWEPIATLLDKVRAVDSTLLHHQGRWWLFANIAPEGGSTTVMLHLFWAETPLGPWTPHRLNPVVADVRSARPAGAVFSYEDRLFRPSQDCSRAYGGGLVFNRIERLDEGWYEETPVRRLAPDRAAGWYGMHTYARAGGFEIIDRLRFVRRRRRSRSSPTAWTM